MRAYRVQAIPARGASSSALPFGKAPCGASPPRPRQARLGAEGAYTFALDTVVLLGFAALIMGA